MHFVLIHLQEEHGFATLNHQYRLRRMQYFTAGSHSCSEKQQKRYIPPIRSELFEPMDGVYLTGGSVLLGPVDHPSANHECNGTCLQVPFLCVPNRYLAFF